MANRFASGKNSIAQCDRCGQRFKLKQLGKKDQNVQLAGM